MSLALLAIPQLVGGVSVESFGTALAVAAVLAVLNVVLKPILILLTLPLTVLSLGLFIFVLNAFMMQMAPFFVSGFHVDSFKSAFISSLIVSIVSWVANVFDERQFRWRISSGRRREASDQRFTE
jgi:putative membrane protein